MAQIDSKYKSTSFRRITNIDQYDMFVWPVNILGYHWALVYHSVVSRTPLFYLYSSGTAEARKSRMSHNMLGAINEFGKRYNKRWVWEDATSFVNVPQQHMNDCGVVVNELSRRLMINERVVDFELNRSVGVKLRVTQAKEIVQFITQKGLN